MNPTTQRKLCFVCKRNEAVPSRHGRCATCNPYNAARPKGAHAIAKAVYPAIYTKYTAVRPTGGQRFSSEIWLSVGGTQQQIDVILKRAAGRRAKRLARRAAAKQKRYGWKEFTRGVRKTTDTRVNKERPQATNTKAQRKLERWVKSVGLWRLGFDRDIHYVVDARKFGGFDFEVREKIGHKLVALVDAKSEMKTTHAQDKQIAAAWKHGTACYLVSRTSYLQLTQMTKRVPNGSIWG